MSEVNRVYGLHTQESEPPKLFIFHKSIIINIHKLELNRKEHTHKSLELFFGLVEFTVLIDLKNPNQLFLFRHDFSRIEVKHCSKRAVLLSFFTHTHTQPNSSNQL